MKIKQIPLVLADLCLPDKCVLCGNTLIRRRSDDFFNLPLCKSCLLSLDAKIFDINFPEIRRCSSCGYPLTSETSLCRRCREKEWNFSSSVSIYLYNDIIKDLIQAYKFDNRISLSKYFARKIFDIYISDFSEYTIVPVPFRPSSKRKRGWDQIEKICKVLEKEYGMPVNSCLSRKDGPAQKTMNFSQRLHNLQDKIKVNSNPIPRKALLLDDVFTTGATMDCCAYILTDAGSEDVCCLALALDL